MRKKLIVLVLVLLVVGALTVELRALEELSGREIMRKVYQRDTGENRQATMEMILVNRHGDERRREIRQFERDFGEVEKTIMFFTAPADVRNTSFMNWSYTDGSNDDQWLYLPALGRVRRIASDNKNDSFMGSDFTYEDMAQRDIDDDKHELITTEEINGQKHYVVESIPQDEDSDYSKTITWVDAENWLGRKKEFYDQDEKLLKVLTNQQYEEIQGILTVIQAEMHDIQDNHKTIMRTKDIDYDNTISETEFTERKMRRGL